MQCIPICIYILYAVKFRKGLQQIVGEIVSCRIRVYLVNENRNIQCKQILHVAFKLSALTSAPLINSTSQ